MGKILRLDICDRQVFTVNSKREYTDEGFLKVPGRVARAGIQDYLASELQLTGDQNRIVKVFRPQDEVFNSESLDTYSHVDITDGHPKKLVDSETYKHVTVGVVASGGVRDGDFVSIDLIIKDADAIKSIESGKAQLSAGYTSEYVQESGVTKDGEKYEFIQRDIKINHVALVDSARAGSMARIFDNKPEVKLMRVTLDNGRAVEVDDTVAGQVEDCIKRLTDAAAEEKGKADASKAKADQLEDEAEEMKKKSSDAAIIERMSVISEVLDTARLIAGKDFTCDSVIPEKIKRAALATVDSWGDLTQKSTAYIDAAFEIQGKKKEAEDEEEEEEKKKSSDSHSNLSKDMANPANKEPSNKQKFNDGLTSAWQKTLDGGKS